MLANSGVLYVVWGNDDTYLQRSIASINRVHPELPVRVHRLPEGSDLLDKAQMFEWTPFEHTLFLDADTVVLRRLDYGFDQAAKHGLACCICEWPWARRYPSLDGDAIEYNTGVLFFSRKAEPLFKRWADRVREIDSSNRLKVGERVYEFPLNDQAGFAKAVEELAFCPFVLPMNWNFRPQVHRSFIGPLKVWHDYNAPPASLLQWNQDPQHDGRVMTMTLLR